MAATLHETNHPTQTHHEVTRDVVNTLGTAGKGYFLLLAGAVGLFLVGIVTFVFLLALLAVVAWIFKTGYRLKN